MAPHRKRPLDIRAWRWNGKHPTYGIAPAWVMAAMKYEDIIHDGDHLSVYLEDDDMVEIMFQGQWIAHDDDGQLRCFATRHYRKRIN